MTGDSRLYLSRTYRDGHILLTAIGTIDRHTVPQLRSMLLPALTRHGPYAVLDLSAVDHLDDAGAEALRRTARRAAALGGYLRLAAPHPAIQATIRDAGLPWCMRVTATLADALTGHHAADDDQLEVPDAHAAEQDQPIVDGDNTDEGRGIDDDAA